LTSGFWKTTGVFDAILETYECAAELERKLKELAE